ncbi:MAG TPA: recombinase family protein [Pirellulales bacterium]|jgi:DNA invertase Pin-like site-specific DNA recombinase|nr:recombinase family protein [Pirellulales bacterium]
MKIIGYIRVSTQKQGRSGLGLEAQRKAVQDYASLTNGQLVAEFVEVESGKDNARVELAKAVARAKAVRGKLVVATLDRLSRKVAFIANLMETNVQFACCDAPNASAFELHVRAAMSEEERRKISERTKLALAAAKRRGVQLGANRRGHRAILKSDKMVQHLDRIRACSIAARHQNAAQRRAECYGHLLPTIQTMVDDNATLQEICDSLNADGHTTTSGGKFYANTVRRLVSALPVIAAAMFAIR